MGYKNNFGVEVYGKPSWIERLRRRFRKREGYVEIKKQVDLSKYDRSEEEQ